jgi:hypothetical protein
MALHSNKHKACLVCSSVTLCASGQLDSPVRFPEETGIIAFFRSVKIVSRAHPFFFLAFAGFYFIRGEAAGV